ncbi:MAG: membrane protein insertase YidC [Bacteroidales bacterium]
MINKNHIYGVVLIFLILIGFSVFTAPGVNDERNAYETEGNKNHAAKTISIHSSKQVLYDKIEMSSNDRSQSSNFSPEGSNLTTKNNIETNDSNSISSVCKDTNYVFETNLMRISISSTGAEIKQIELNEFKTGDSMPLKFFYNNEADFDLAFSTDSEELSTSEMQFVPVYTNKLCDNVSKDSLVVVLKAPAYDKNMSEVGAVLFKYTFFNNSYQINLNIDFQENSDFLKEGKQLMKINWSADLATKEKNRDKECSASTVYYAKENLRVDNLSETDNDEAVINTPLKWISFKQQFFSTSIIAKEKFVSASLKSLDKGMSDPCYLKTMQSSMLFEYDAKKNNSVDFQIYAGPNKYSNLKPYNLHLEHQIPLGWSFRPIAWVNQYIVIPVFNWLEDYSLNYGIIILILTVFLKIGLSPITIKTYISSAKMRALKPEIESISKRFPNSDDALAKQKELMNLYQQAGVNPFSGCMPMLLQFPILIAMFNFFPASFELRQQPFLWADDLSNYDSVLDLGFNIPFYGDHISMFCLLMTISTIVYTRLNEKVMGDSSGNVPGMKTLMYIMPLTFLGFFNSYSAGLSYYYLLANIFSFIQIFAIRKIYNEKKVRVQMSQANKKNRKRSGLQTLLDAAIKNSQTQPE